MDGMANSIDPDELLLMEQFDLDLHRLPMHFVVKVGVQTLGKLL